MNECVRIIRQTFYGAAARALHLISRGVHLNAIGSNRDQRRELPAAAAYAYERL
jgi:hypothetical protein